MAKDGVAGPGTAGTGDGTVKGDRAGPRSRRGLLRDAALLALGAGIGTAGVGELADLTGRRLVLRGGAAAATSAGPHGVRGRGELVMTWEVKTELPLVALTFDDGPRPQWTTRVLDVLDEFAVPATFFVVGRRLRKYASVIDGRLDRHEIGNHTWNHLDLARRNDVQSRDDLARAHEAIVDIVGVPPVLFRPPYGHIGGAAAQAAAELGYQVILWSRKMCEARYTTREQVAAVLRQTTPGAIWLAHDTGAKDRLVSIRGLPAMITGLRERGFEFVTVSHLMAKAELAV
ncbi:MAG: polysaccharide deacetylase family protein [Dactylosporangium sp.]|nr:polysaccharide deacetylase family protein [Dactylosporangium sp.]NNJ60794.1 polysaccharide deacetylase family protein [Dactylosporangium sp.]